MQAKRDADDALTQSGLDWTIVKPGHLPDAATCPTPRQRRRPGQPHLRPPR
jgi:hypothetical protein